MAAPKMVDPREWDRHGSHLGYGPASAECCDIAFVDVFGSVQAFKLPPQNDSAAGGAACR